MSFFIKGGRIGRSGWITAFFCGFFLGITTICLGYQQLVWNTDFLARDSFVRILQLEINKSSLFVYVLQNRLEIVAFLILFSAAGAAGAASLFFLCWSGLTSGIVLTVLSVRYGIKGIFLFCGCILPQHILLVPGFLLLLDWCCIKSQKKRIFLPLLLVLAGCLLEAYVNPAVLKLILRIFTI